MPSKSCAHKYNAKKMQERVDNLIAFMKNATPAQVGSDTFIWWGERARARAVSRVINIAP